MKSAATHRTTVLIILDGWGMANAKLPGNAITPATAPNFFSWLKKHPHTLLSASGSDVGLFEGEEGNSEAGHLNIGGGRVVKQDALYISDSIADKTFYKNFAFTEAMRHQKKYSSAVHVMGLLSNHNSAHSCPEHLYALLDFLHEQGAPRTYVHLFTDGRDSGQHAAKMYLEQLMPHLKPEQTIATMMGRLYGMDRNKNWDRTEKAFNAIVNGQAAHRAVSGFAAIEASYARGESDEFMEPTLVIPEGATAATVHDNDAVFFFNMRSDRARQLTKTFVQPDFEHANPNGFKRSRQPANIRFVAMADFGPDLPHILTAYPSRDVEEGLVQTISPRPQLHIAESEKYAHVTYFLNGGHAQRLPGERWEKIDSDRVTAFHLAPAMKAREIALQTVQAIESGDYEFIAVNFANADMVGHTGDYKATCTAISVVDDALKYIALAAAGKARIIITADHGNAEIMVKANGQGDSEHSTSPVPFVIVTDGADRRHHHLTKLHHGKLADVAPTVLKLMELPVPPAMTGKPLF